jgi:hypothetical protein
MLKIAEVLALAALVKVTPAGPLTRVHSTVKVFAGRPSSVTTPVRLAAVGSVIV